MRDINAVLLVWYRCYFKFDFISGMEDPRMDQSSLLSRARIIYDLDVLIGITSIYTWL